MALNDAVHWSADLGAGIRVALVQAGTFRSDAGALFGPVPRKKCLRCRSAVSPRESVG